MNYFRLPVTSEPNQTFDTTIDFGNENKSFRVFFNWNLCTNTWEMSCWEKSTDIPLFLHIPLIEGGNIISYLSYKGIGGIAVINNGGAGDRPNIENLGTEWIICWVVE